MGPIGSPETSLRNYHYLLRNNPKERSSNLLRSGSLKSRLRFKVLTASTFRLEEEAVRSHARSVEFYQSTRRHIREDDNLQTAE
jgi:hypothetical protein